MTSAENPVIVVGCGIAGLGCARALYDHGIAPEAGRSVGGRIKALLDTLRAPIGSFGDWPQWRYLSEKNPKRRNP